VTSRYNIDKSRLFTTGQSMGAIMSIVMDIQHPDLFAASYIVAGQWDSTKVSPMIAPFPCVKVVVVTVLGRSSRA
jgi:predicted peptidase